MHFFIQNSPIMCIPPLEIWINCFRLSCRWVPRAAAAEERLRERHGEPEDDAVRGAHGRDAGVIHRALRLRDAVQLSGVARGNGGAGVASSLGGSLATLATAVAVSEPEPALAGTAGVGLPHTHTHARARARTRTRTHTHTHTHTCTHTRTH
eukprot:COSAG03_NODE_3853_length_1794_cov_3.370501_1_plen_151_part_10